MAKKEKALAKNKIPVLVTALRYLSVFAALMVFFPLLVGTETYFQAITDTKVILLRFALVEGCGFLGFFTSMLLSAIQEKWKVPNPVVNIICILFCTAPVWGMYLACGPISESYRTLCMMAFGGIAYFMGSVFYYRPYGQINTKVTLAWLCGLHFLVIVLLLMLSFTYTHNIVPVDMPMPEGVQLSDAQIALMDKVATERILANGFSYDLSMFVPEFLIYISIFGLTANQSHIDYLMERRKHKMEDLPKWVRTYNFWLTSSIMAVIAVLFLCKDYIIAGIQWIAKITGFVIVKVMWWFGSLFVHEEFEEFYVPEVETAEDFEVIVSEGGQRSTMIFSYFIVIMLLIAFIYVLFKFRVFQKLWTFLKTTGMTLLHRFKEGSGTYKPRMIEQEFVDSETELDADTRKKRGKENGSAFKQWRKAYKEFLKIKEQDKRYEQGFSLLADYFKLRGVALKQGDTALQIESKAVKGKKLDETAGSEITEGYHLLCYAEKGNDAAKLSILEKALHKAYTDSKSLKTVGV